MNRNMTTKRKLELIQNMRDMIEDYSSRELMVGLCHFIKRVSKDAVEIYELRMYLREMYFEINSKFVPVGYWWNNSDAHVVTWYGPRLTFLEKVEERLKNKLKDNK